MQLTPRIIADWCDRELEAPCGYLTIRRYATGWLVRFVPFDPARPVEKIEGVNASTACNFANKRLKEGPDCRSSSPPLTS